MMNILADENLAYVDYFFSDFAQITSMAGRKIQASDLHAKDALLVRSVTPVNATLLQNSAIQFVGSATIGTDHLDLDYLTQQKIHWANAQGCNAQAVAEYVVTALYHVQPMLFQNDSSKETPFCLGIIGLGHVGSRLARLALALGWKVLAYDPFKMAEQPLIEGGQWASFEQVLQADAISIHVPLTKTGAYPTYHLFNANSFAKMNPKAILINAARGAVIAEQDLLDDIAKNNRIVVLDVFEHEPILSEKLIESITLITPHIAGYSLEGKVQGTAMIYQAFCEKFQIHAPHKTLDVLLPAQPRLFTSALPLHVQLQQHLKEIYPILRDDRDLRACLKNGVIQAEAFDALRKNYPLRREWSAYGFELL